MAKQSNAQGENVQQDGDDAGTSGAGRGSGGPSGTPNVARDTDGRGSANDETVRDPNVEAVTAAFEGRGAGGGGSSASSNDDMPASGISRDGPDAIDLDDFSGGSRREPGR